MDTIDLCKCIPIAIIRFIVITTGGHHLGSYLLHVPLSSDSRVTLQSVHYVHNIVHLQLALESLVHSCHKLLNF